jgi:hypothetical protein
MRMLETGVPFPVLAMLMAWSAATTVRMAKGYNEVVRFLAQTRIVKGPGRILGYSVWSRWLS